MGNTIQKIDTVIIGSGFAGMGMAIQLKKAGGHDFIILEQDQQFGGTWRVNDYPGAECDVHSHLYQFSFEPNPNWNKMFGTQQEILDYCLHCAEKYQLMPHVRLNSGVTDMQFNEKNGTWTVHTSDQQTYEARFVVSGAGGLSRPLIPTIKGLKSYKGTLFHTARWNHDFDYKGKCVAVIGSGASAIQVVPAIAGDVAHLTLFQRTPSWVIPKPDRAITSVEKTLFKLLPFTQNLYRGGLFVRNELMAVGFVVDHRVMKLFQPIAEKYIERSVKDPELRRKVTPQYTIGCKRILLSNDYYPALNRDNVTVISEGVREITPKGIRTADGTEHAFDAIILATGFQASESPIAFDVTGLRQLPLRDAWKTSGPEAYLGTVVHGYPNFFTIIGPNTGLGHSSMILMIEHQVHYILEYMKAEQQLHAKYLDVKKDVQDVYNAAIQKRLNKAVWGDAGGCASWYKTAEGKNTTLWPGFTFEFKARTWFFRKGDYDVVRFDAPQNTSTQPGQKEPVLAEN